MPKRYTKIHLGDQGTSQVHFNDPIRIPKSDLIFEFFGKGDELIAHINLLFMYDISEEVKAMLEYVIDLIYRFMADISDKKAPFTRVTKKDLNKIEYHILVYETSNRIDRFIYRYSVPGAIISNLIRVKVREFERIYNRLPTDFHSDMHLSVANRLSNLFFELALWYEDIAKV